MLTPTQRINRTSIETISFNQKSKGKLRFILVPSPMTPLNNEQNYFDEYVQFLNNIKPFEIEKMKNGAYLLEFLSNKKLTNFFCGISEYYGHDNPISLAHIGWLNEIPQERLDFYKEYGLVLIKGF